jgi:hypothetical protein
LRGDLDKYIPTPFFLQFGFEKLMFSEEKNPLEGK